MTDDRTRAWLARLIAQAEREGFYGSVLLIFESGSLVRAELKQSLKPPAR